MLSLSWYYVYRRREGTASSHQHSAVTFDEIVRKREIARSIVAAKGGRTSDYYGIDYAYFHNYC